MEIREKLPGMTPESGVVNLIRNIFVGSVYVVGGFVFMMFLLSALIVGFGGVESGSDDGEAIAEASTDDASADEAEEADASATDVNSADEADEAEKADEVEEAEEADSVSDPESIVISDGGSDVVASEEASPVDIPIADEADEASEYVGFMSPEAMEFVLDTEFGLNVDVSDDGDDGIIVNYTSPALSEVELAGDLGAIAGTYAAMVDDGYPTEELEFHIWALDGTAAGYTALDADDAQAWMDGDMSDDELALKVLNENMVPYDQ